MRVEITKSFHWAPDGNNVRQVAVGEVLEGRGAEVALELKSGRIVVVVARLPLLEEYVAAGYTAEGYPRMLESETARAKAEGLEVEVRLPTLAETGVSREEFEERLIEKTRQKLDADKADAERAAREAAQKAAEPEPSPAEAEPAPAAPTPPAATPPAPPKRRNR